MKFASRCVPARKAPRQASRDESSRQMKVRINGDDREIPDGLTVATLLTYIGMPTERVAIERNLDILPRANWKTTEVLANDSYEIVHFVGGG